MHQLAAVSRQLQVRATSNDAVCEALSQHALRQILTDGAFAPEVRARRQLTLPLSRAVRSVRPLAAGRAD